MRFKLSRIGKWFLIIALALAFLVALAWERIALVVAYAMSDSRPSLLRDAQWDKPDTAKAFQQQFGSGSSEMDLVRWLEANHFRLDRQARTAKLKIGGVPCGEDVAVSWVAVGDTIQTSSALVSEAGCL